MSEDIKSPSSAEKLVEQFQCSGCVSGSNTSCGVYSPKSCNGSVWCESHVLGTISMTGNFALGLPKGFCRPGINYEANPPRVRNKIDIRLWPSGTKPEWDKLNVPVWAMIKDGFLFVRTFAPRISRSWVGVIEHGTIEMVPNAINVSEFIDEID